MGGLAVLTSIFQYSRRDAGASCDHSLPGVLQHVCVQGGSGGPSDQKVCHYNRGQHHLPLLVPFTACVGHGESL